MKLYNTASRSLEEIKPINDAIIKFYSCGPTVYDKPTIGNWASFIRYDILARALQATGYKTNWIMNITDVGHLVSDADEGEDKLEKGARRESKTAWEIADYYSGYFIEGLDFFNISIPRENVVRATDFIDEQIKLVKKLQENGQTYETSDGIYFDSTTFNDYGKMARLNLSGLKSGARVDKGEKKNPTDFALWKFSPKGKKRDMEWESPWGEGFPGWHLECSAIILSSLGETIDIHAGGIEHIPVHHTNEIAQSESATHKPLANIWVHNNHLTIEGNKISKSLGNGYTVEDLKRKGFNGLDFRMFVLSGNYRNEANFTWELLDEAKRRLSELQKLADLRYQPAAEDKPKSTKDLKNIKKQILEALENNLNTGVAVIGLLSDLNTALSKGLIYERKEYLEFLSWLDQTFGFKLLDSKDLEPEQKEMINRRNLARKNKDWESADKIRDGLKKHGVNLEDVGNGSLWYRA